MSDPHNPEHSEGSDRGFKPSVPDLTPNLGEYQTVGTGNPDRGVATHFENNDEGRVADHLRDRHTEHSRYVEQAQEDAKESRESRKDTQVAVEELRLALEDLEATDPDNLGDKFALTQALKILEARGNKWSEQQQAAEEEASRQGRAVQAVDFVAGEHFRENEEAYKNQAVNDARRAGVDVNYPPYTNQELSSSQGDTRQVPEKTGGVFISPNLEGNIAGQVAQELRDRVTDGDESANAEAAAHYYANEEAYRNQAIMDADKAGVDIDTGSVKTTSAGNHKKVEIRNTVITGDVIGNDMRRGGE